MAKKRKTGRRRSRPFRTKFGGNRTKHSQPQEVGQVQSDAGLRIYSRLRCKENFSSKVNYEIICNVPDENLPTARLVAEVDSLRTALREIKNELDDTPDSINQIKNSISFIRAAVAEFVQSVLRSIKFSEELTIEEGQAFASEVNNLLDEVHLRIRMPRTDSPGTLLYQRVAKKNSSHEFVAYGAVDGRSTTRSVGCDLSRIELMDAPPDRRRIVKRTKTENSPTS